MTTPPVVFGSKQQPLGAADPPFQGVGDHREAQFRRVETCADGEVDGDREVVDAGALGAADKGVSNLEQGDGCLADRERPGRGCRWSRRSSWRLRA